MCHRDDSSASIPLPLTTILQLLFSDTTYVHAWMLIAVFRLAYLLLNEYTFYLVKFMTYWSKPCLKFKYTSYMICIILNMLLTRWNIVNKKTHVWMKIIKKKLDEMWLMKKNQKLSQSNDIIIPKCVTFLNVSISL